MVNYEKIASPILTLKLEYIYFLIKKLEKICVHTIVFIKIVLINKSFLAIPILIWGVSLKM